VLAREYLVEKNNNFIANIERMGDNYNCHHEKGEVTPMMVDFVSRQRQLALNIFKSKYQRMRMDLVHGGLPLSLRVGRQRILKSNKSSTFD